MSLLAEDDPDIAAFGEDLEWPLRLDGNNDLAVVRGLANLESALPIRAMTELGEVPVFPNDGLNLEDLSGGPACDEERAALEARLVEQYRRDDRLVSVDVDVIEGDLPGDTVAQITAYTRTGVPLPIEVPFGA